MITADRIASRRPCRMDVPDTRDVGHNRSGSVLPAMDKHLPCPAADIIRNALQWLSDGVRWTRDRLANVDTPVMISRIWYVNADTCQTAWLVPRPSSTSSESKPATCGQEALLTIHIETL